MEKGREKHGGKLNVFYFRVTRKRGINASAWAKGGNCWSFKTHLRRPPYLGAGECDLRRVVEKPLVARFFFVSHNRFGHFAPDSRPHAVHDPVKPDLDLSVSTNPSEITWHGCLREAQRCGTVGRQLFRWRDTSSASTTPVRINLRARSHAYVVDSYVTESSANQNVSNEANETIRTTSAGM